VTDEAGTLELLLLSLAISLRSDHGENFFLAAFQHISKESELRLHEVVTSSTLNREEYWIRDLGGGG
jgi:hypothetical protein